MSPAMSISLEYNIRRIKESIVAFPPFFAVTIPAPSTLATAVLEEEYFRDLFVASDGETETLREYFSPGFIDFSAALVEMLFTRIGFTVILLFPL